MTEPKRTKRAKPDPELLKLADSLLANYQKPEDLIGENGLLKQLTKALFERGLEAEMVKHSVTPSILQSTTPCGTHGTARARKPEGRLRRVADCHPARQPWH